MTITACPKCGSRKIFQGRLKEGVLTGYTSKEVCRDCGYHGSPIIFDSMEEYNKFLEGLKAEKEGKPSKVFKDDEKMSKKEKEVIDFLNDLSEEEKNKTIDDKKPRFLKNSLSYLSVIVIIASIWLTSRGGFLTMYGIALLIVGVILFIIGIFSYKEEIKYQSSKPTFGGIFLMMAGVIGIITWIEAQTMAMDPLYLQQLGLDISLETFSSFMLICALVGIIFSILSILGGILAIKRKNFLLTMVCGFFGLLVLGSLLSSSILAFVGLALIFISRNEFKK